MIKKRIFQSMLLGIMAGVLMVSGFLGTRYIQSAHASPSAAAATGVYTQRFMTLYNKIKDPANGYFSPLGIPYHSVETLIVEAPDYGHETTSEAFSFWLWLEATFGQVSGNWTPFTSAWTTMETYIIPSHSDQPSNAGYTPNSPAQYAPESPLITDYPTQLTTSVTAGTDPLAAELQAAYGTPDVYGMAWLIDVDNWYGYGHCGDGTTRPSYINSYQRGASESVWKTIVQPSCETFRWGRSDGTGFLSLFQLQAAGSAFAQQWRYTDAPDADARAVQAAYWALVWSAAQGKQAQVATQIANSAKMGDYLRYSFFDKYFKAQGCTSPNCAAGSGKNSSSYLLDWYYAWGGALPVSGTWAWRIGASSAHQGYQNPLAAWALSTIPAMQPKGATAVTDWTTALQRQLQFYQWLQSSEGAIAGGATNSWNGRYEAPPAGLPTFFGMAYDFQPVFHDPPSNNWFGFQAWSMERVAEYYYVSSNATAKAILDKWVAWAKSVTTINANGTYAIPSTLNWSGQPGANWTATTTSVNNAGLHVTVVDTSQDVGVTAAYAKTLLYYSARSGDTASRTLAQTMLDDMWNNFSDAIGISSPEQRKDYNQFNISVFVPAGWTGTNAQGATINPSLTFLSERPKYTADPSFAKVQTYLSGGVAPTFNYHRFWAASDIAMAMADVDILFPLPGTPGTTPTVGTTPTTGITPGVTPTATPTRGITPTPTTGVTPTPTVGVTPTATPTRGVTPTPTTVAGAACRVTYTITSTWPGNFGATFAITNTGTTAINGWTLTFTFANGQTITQLWNGTFVQSAGNVTVTSMSYNAVLAPGATMSSPPGFNGTQTGTNAIPTSFKLNGVTCTS